MCFVDLEKAPDRVPRKVLEWVIHGRCAILKRVAVKFSKNVACRKCGDILKNTGEAVDQEEKIRDEVEIESLHI